MDTTTDYYNNFAMYMVKTGINIRHRTIFHELVKAGLKRNMKVLEVGCGIGQVTSLVSQYLRKGSITAIDISPENIKIAKDNFPWGNIQFIVGDICSFYLGGTYDFVVFPDSLEHIPVGCYKDIFEKLSRHVHPDGTIFINTPDPYFQDYMTWHHPDKQQIVDESVHDFVITEHLCPNHFFIHSLKRYSLAHRQPDYQQLILKVSNSYSTIEKLSWIELAYKEILSRMKIMKHI